MYRSCKGFVEETYMSEWISDSWLKKICLHLIYTGFCYPACLCVPCVECSHGTELVTLPDHHMIVVECQIIGLLEVYFHYSWLTNDVFRIGLSGIRLSKSPLQLSCFTLCSWYSRFEHPRLLLLCFCTLTSGQF